MPRSTPAQCHQRTREQSKPGVGETAKCKASSKESEPQARSRKQSEPKARYRKHIELALEFGCSPQGLELK